MRSYKVEIIETQKYVLDIQAESEAEAEKKAYAKYQELEESNIKHYHEYGDLEAEVGLVYDVTGSDDDAFLQQDLEEVAELEEKLSHDKEWTNQ